MDNQPITFQQILQIHDLFYRNVSFIEIDYLIDSPGSQQIPSSQSPLNQNQAKFQNYFILREKCLIITEKAFDRYYRYLGDVLSPKCDNHEQSYKLKCSDILITMNGQNQRVWNLKKGLLSQIRVGPNQPHNLLNFNDELKLNAAILMKFKKNTSCYEYRYTLIQHLCKPQNKHILHLITQVQQQQISLINRILDRFPRNYFCWMYRLKLIKHILIDVLVPLNKQLQRQEIERTVITLYNQEIESVHHLLQKNPNDYSAITYLIFLTGKAKNHIILHVFEMNIKQLYAQEQERQWAISHLSFCHRAYDSQSNYYQFLVYCQRFLSEAELKKLSNDNQIK